LNPNLNPKKGTLTEVVHIHVLDDDSIVDSEGTPLGGPNTPTWTDNGKFTYYGPFAFADLMKPEEDNFEQVQKYLSVLTKPYLPFINFAVSFDEDKLDINGNLFPLVQQLLNDEDVDPESLYIKGNGMLDSYEFALLERCIKDDSIDLSANGGISHTLVANAWTQNLARIRNDLGGAITPEHDNMVLRVFAGLDSLFCAYLTFGEMNTVGTISAASVALTSESVSQFLPGLTFTPIDSKNYQLLTNYLGAKDINGNGILSPSEFADADKDGFTNAQEYLYFECDGKQAFVNSALDPNIKPPQFPPPRNFTVNEGTNLRLYVPELLHVYLTTYEWYKDGVLLTANERIKGTSKRTVNIEGLTLEDSGTYMCYYCENDPNNYVVKSYGPITVNVQPEVQEGEGSGTEGEGSVTEGEGLIEGEGVIEGSLEGVEEGIVEGIEEGEGEGQEVQQPHSLDTDGDFKVELTELLRVIQFYNYREYSCAPSWLTTEDGYVPGNRGDRSCQPHASDYNPQDWSISFEEILRAIQIFNSPSYYWCPGQGKDNFCVKD